MGFWDAEWLTAFGGVITGVLGALAIRKKSKKEETVTPSIHQEVVRPATAAEMSSATALESIATSLSKIERHVDLLVDRRDRNK